MKLKLLIAFVALSFFSCKKEEENKESLYPSSNTEAASEGDVANLTPSQKIGQEIFDGKGNCFSCHKADQKIIGPSVMEIAKIYKEKNGDMVQFLKGKGKPIVDPSQYAVMEANFAITKNFTDEELKGLEEYFYSIQAK